jgi:hypothetical protein
MKIGRRRKMRGRVVGEINCLLAISVTEKII